LPLEFRENHSIFSATPQPRRDLYPLQPVILSEVVARKAHDNTVEGPRARLQRHWLIKEFSPRPYHENAIRHLSLYAQL